MLSFDLWEQVPKLNSEVDYLQISGTLSEPEVLILAGVDGRATLRRIAENLRYDREMLTRMVARLTARKVLLFSDPLVVKELTAEDAGIRLDFGDPAAKMARARAAREQMEAAAATAATAAAEAAPEAAPAATAEEAAAEEAARPSAVDRFVESGEWNVDTFFDLVGRCYVQRRDGVLRFYRDAETYKAFYFVEGRIANISSVPFSAGECLGRLAQRAGVISEATVVESLARVKETGCKQGEALAAMGAMKQDKIDDMLRVQLEVKASPIFEWDHGLWTFEEAPLPARLPQIHTSLPRLLFNLAWKRYPAHRVGNGIKKHLVEYIGRRDAPTFLAFDFEFTDNVGKFAMQAIDKDFTVKRLLVASILQPEYAYRMIWSLYLLGVVDFFRLTHGERLTQRVAELKNRVRAMGQESLFDALQVHWSAGDKALHRAQARLIAETEHAMIVCDATERELLAQIRDRLRQAYAALRTPEGRRAYREGLFGPERLAAGVDAIREKGEAALFVENNPAQAAVEFEAAQEVDGRNVEGLAEWGLALLLRDLAADGPGVEEGRRLIRQAADAAPASARVHLCAALMHRAEGKTARAAIAIKRALQLDPANGFARAIAEELVSGLTPENLADEARKFVERRTDRKEA